MIYLHTLQLKSLSRRRRALQIFNIYRFVLAACCLFLSSFSLAPLAHSGNSVTLNFLTGGYLLGSLIPLMLVAASRPSFKSLVVAGTLLDIGFLLALIQLSQGLETGIGILLNMTLAACALLLMDNLALFLAAVASIALVLQQMLFASVYFYQGAGYFHVGLLCFCYFVITGVMLSLARRVHASEAFAEQQTADIAKLTKLTELVVQRLQSGILVITDKGDIVFCNSMAQRLLGCPLSEQPTQLQTIHADLAENWREALQRPRNFQVKPGAPKCQVTVKRLTSQEYLLILDDTAQLTSQAQDLKLASLGRFTASIAHEIRNPLGAISHAVQLLMETPNMPEEALALNRIIVKQSERMNAIVKNVLQLSRREKTSLQDIHLPQWMHEFSEQLRHSYPYPVDITLCHETTPLCIQFDPSQLYQVVTNLCDNGFRYSQAKIKRAKILIRSGKAEQPYLEVIDWGEGISEQLCQQIFEPFFTTERSGTGLGLYVAKELCEANRAQLDYLPSALGGCFRISFSERYRAA